MRPFTREGVYANRRRPDPGHDQDVAVPSRSHERGRFGKLAQPLKSSAKVAAFRQNKALEDVWSLPHRCRAGHPVTLDSA